MSPEIQQAWANCFSFTLIMGFSVGLIMMMESVELPMKKEQWFWMMLTGTVGLGMMQGWLAIVMEVMR